MKRNNEKGFTLIELMIVIAIIGILAAIAIPNFIAYRNKAYCSATESDASAVAAAVADYYTVPTRVNLLAKTDIRGVNFTAPNTSADLTIGGTVDSINIQMVDKSGRCPEGNGFSKTLGGGAGYWY